MLLQLVVSRGGGPPSLGGDSDAGSQAFGMKSQGGLTQEWSCGQVIEQTSSSSKKPSQRVTLMAPSTLW